MRIPNVIPRALFLAACGAALAAPASAQLANASATTLGLSGNATATARGLAALSVNPAGLGMPGSGFTLAIVPLQLRSGLDPVTLKDLNDVAGVRVSAATREEWLDRIADAGSESGAIGVDVSGLGLSVGRFGIQLSTVVAADMNLAPDVTELMLFGNAGRTGRAVDITLTGSDVTAFAVSTVGASVGFPIARDDGAMAVGATVKYSVGHGIVVGRVTSGSVRADPLVVSLDFPVVMNAEKGGINNGSGIGLDVGFQMKSGAFGLGAAVINAVNSFKWDEEKLVYRPGTARFDVNGSTDDFEERPLATAPAALVTPVADMKFDPTLSVGASYDVSEAFTLSADVRNRFGDGMALAPKMHAGVGAEFRGLKVLHLRGGAAIVTDGMEFAGGASLVLGPVSLTGAAGKRTGDLDDTTIGQFTLSFGGR